jgi:hypothetical protein
MDKQTKEYRAGVRAEINPDLVFIRQLDRMLDEFLNQRDYSEFYGTVGNQNMPSDETAIREAQRRIHLIRLSLAFKEHEPEADVITEADLGLINE